MNQQQHLTAWAVAFALVAAVIVLNTRELPPSAMVVHNPPEQPGLVADRPDRDRFDEQLDGIAQIDADSGVPTQRVAKRRSAPNTSIH